MGGWAGVGYIIKAPGNAVKLAMERRRKIKRDRQRDRKKEKDKKR